MVLRFGSPDPNWQFSQELALRRFTTRPLPNSNFCTYVNLRQVRIGINRAIHSQMTDTKAAKKHAEFPDTPTAGSSQKCHEREGSGGMKANDIPYQIPLCGPIIAYTKG